MVELTGDTLGERQRDLNFKVAEIVKKKVDFKEINPLEEKCDTDKFFKIDVASKYRNIDYFIEVLKGGDSLFISRVLKCDWLYEDDYSHTINPDYLHQKIFPYMAIKMKIKMINAIASHVRNEARAEEFSIYCKKYKMKHLALKFFLFTSEQFKLDQIKKDSQYLSQSGYPELFIGSSFTIAEAFLSTDHYVIDKESLLNKLHHLYNIDKERYLNLLEKHIKPQNTYQRFGRRLSKSIMTKHKDRVLKYPLLYINKIHNRLFRRYTKSAEDAKTYIIGLLPSNVSDFWNNNFYLYQNYLFDLIPYNEIYQFLKKAFISAYGDQPFEMTYKFYYYRYYEFLTQDERERWALKGLEEGKELLGNEKDYIWYKFINFGVAFPAIKKYILITPDIDIRNEMLSNLVDSVRNKQDLQTLISYYYNRHNNESIEYKKRFVSALIDKCNVFECDETSWLDFNKLLHSMDVFTTEVYGWNQYQLVCVIYNIIHNIEMPTILLQYISEMQINALNTQCTKLKSEEKQLVFEYLYDFYFKKFRQCIKWDKKETLSQKVEYARDLFHILQCFSKTKEDMPEEVMTFIKSDHSRLKFESFFQDKNEKGAEKVVVKEPEVQYRIEKLSQNCLMRLLKKEKQIIVELLPDLTACIGKPEFKFAAFLKKIKTYFPNDLAKDFLELFEKALETTTDDYHNWQIIKNATYSIFNLGDENSILQLLHKNVPDEPKIDHSTIDRKLLVTQEAICRFVCYSRVPVPLEAILPYIKGDYVFFCLPMFNNYLNNLPLPLCVNFIERILNSPLSVQKHGIRLAFTAFSPENLKNLICNVWNKTKNISLREIIYTSLFDKIISSIESTQDHLYYVLKTLTLTLHDEDQQEVFDRLASNEIPEKFKGDYLQAAWQTVKKLPHKKAKNISIKINVICKIETDIEAMDRDFLKAEMIDEHIENMLIKKQIQDSYTELETSYNNCLWNVTAKYIVASNNQEEFKKSVELIRTILRESFKQWNYISKNTFVVMQNCYIFTERIKERTELTPYKYSDYNVGIFEKIVEVFGEFTPQIEVYMLVIDLKLFTIAKRVIVEEKHDQDIKRAAKNATKQLVLFMDDLKSNNYFYKIFYNRIVDLISHIFKKMASVIGLNGDLLLAFVTNELLSFNAYDTTLLALSLMPLEISTSYDSQRVEFKNLLSALTLKVKEINDFEIQSFLYNKFIVSGFKKRCD